MNRYATVMFSFVVVGCVYTPPETPAPATRNPTVVTASVDRVWVATIDFFADRNIPIRTLDRLSGFIATEPLRVADSLAVDWADCGRSNSGPLAPEAAVYNVRVRGDSAKATVQITVHWSSVYNDVMDSRNSRGVDCVTLNKWEADAEALIKVLAERRSP